MEVFELRIGLTWHQWEADPDSSRTDRSEFVAGWRHRIDAKTLLFYAISWMHNNGTFPELAIDRGQHLIGEAIKLASLS
jgi:hypothetical protein